MKNFNYIAPLAVNEQIFFTVDTQGMIESSRYIYIYIFRSEATFIVYLFIIFYELHDTDNHNQEITRVSQVINFNLQCSYIYLFIYCNVRYL